MQQIEGDTRSIPVFRDHTEVEGEESKVVGQVPETFTRYFHKTSLSKALTACSCRAYWLARRARLFLDSEAVIQSVSHSRSLLAEGSYGLQSSYVRLRRKPLTGRLIWTRSHLNTVHKLKGIV